MRLPITIPRICTNHKEFLSAQAPSSIQVDATCDRVAHAAKQIHVYGSPQRVRPRAGSLSNDWYVTTASIYNRHGNMIFEWQYTRSQLSIQDFPSSILERPPGGP
jgi:hypothetical protein